MWRLDGSARRGRFDLVSVFQDGKLLGEEAFVLGEGTVPGSFICYPALWAKPAPRPPALSGRGAAAAGPRAPGAPSLPALRSSRGAGRTRLGWPGHGAGSGARAWRALSSVSACCSVGLRGDALFSGLVSFQAASPTPTPLCVQTRPGVSLGPRLPERAQRNILSRFPCLPSPEGSGNASGCPARG